MTDLIEQITAVRRKVVNRTLGSGEGRAIVISQVYDARIDDVWDACTNPVRLARWFAPVSGDLELGGKYQIEGNASGTIQRCQPGRSFALTWEWDGDVSWVELKLTEESGSRTRLDLEHAMAVNKHWEEYGPGASGVGWDISLASLATHLAGGSLPPEEEWTTASEGAQFLASASEKWRQAGVDNGEDPVWAKAAAERTTTAYTAS